MIRSLLLALCVGCTTSPQAPGPSEPTLRLSAGGAVYRVDRAGLQAAMSAPSKGVRIYNVWATWCAPCIAELPELEAFADAHPAVEVWFVNADHPKTRLLPVLEKHGIDDRNHLAPTAEELDITGALPDFPQVLPTTYLVGPQGEVRRRIVGRVDVASLAQWVSD